MAFTTAADALNLNGNLWRIATNGVIGCHNNKSSLPLNNARMEKDAERREERERELALRPRTNEYDAST